MVCCYSQMAGEDIFVKPVAQGEDNQQDGLWSGNASQHASSESDSVDVQSSSGDDVPGDEDQGTKASSPSPSTQKQQRKKKASPRRAKPRKDTTASEGRELVRSAMVSGTDTAKQEEPLAMDTAIADVSEPWTAAAEPLPEIARQRNRAAPGKGRVRTRTICVFGLKGEEEGRGKGGTAGHYAGEGRSAWDDVWGQPWLRVHLMLLEQLVQAAAKQVATEVSTVNYMKKLVEAEGQREGRAGVSKVENPAKSLASLPIAGPQDAVGGDSQGAVKCAVHVITATNRLSMAVAKRCEPAHGDQTPHREHNSPVQKLPSFKRLKGGKKRAKPAPLSLKDRGPWIPPAPVKQSINPLAKYFR